MIGSLATRGPHGAVREASVGPAAVLRVDSRPRFPATRRRPGLRRARLRRRVPAGLRFLRKYLPQRTRFHFQGTFGLFTANVVRGVVAVRSQRRWRAETFLREADSLVLRQAGARPEGGVVRAGVSAAAHPEVSAPVHAGVRELAVEAAGGARVPRTQVIQLRVSEGRPGRFRDASRVGLAGDAAPERGREGVPGALAFADEELPPGARGNAIHVPAAVIGVREPTLRPAEERAAGAKGVARESKGIRILAQRNLCRNLIVIIIVIIITFNIL